MRVVIVGAGVGGLALARGLIAGGHRVQVLEQGPALRVGGAGVTVFSNGTAALAGLGAALPADIGGRIDRMDFRLADGTRYLSSDVDVMARATGFPVVTVSRAALLEHLATGVADDVIRFGVTVASVDADAACVRDGHGNRFPADVVVGADGHRSVVRQQVVDPTPATDTGWATWQGLSGVLPATAAGTTAHLLVGTAGFVGIMPAGHGRCQWWFDVPWRREDPTPTDLPVWLRERFGRYADPVPQLLDDLAGRDIALYPHVAHAVPDRWGTGAVTLLGDAAHAFPPTQAQGANQALEDAWLLTRALNGTGGPGVDEDPAAALRGYGRSRGRRVRRVSRLAVSEMTDRVPNAAVRALGRAAPPALVGRLHLAMLRRWSSVLNDETSTSTP